MPDRLGCAGESAPQRPGTYSSISGTDRTAIRFTAPSRPSAGCWSRAGRKATNGGVVMKSRAAGVQKDSFLSGLAAADGLPGCLAVSGAAVAGGAGDADGLGAGGWQVEGVEVGFGHGAVEADGLVGHRQG